MTKPTDQSAAPSQNNQKKKNQMGEKSKPDVHFPPETEEPDPNVDYPPEHRPEPQPKENKPEPPPPKPTLS